MKKKISPEMAEALHVVEMIKKHREYEVTKRAAAVAKAETMVGAVRVSLNGGRKVTGDRLLAFVVEYEADLVEKPIEDFELIVIKAALAARNERQLAKWLPGFLWRAQDQIDMLKLADAVMRKNLGNPEDSRITRNYVGYCMELLQRFGTKAGLDLEMTPGLEEAIGDLKKVVGTDEPVLFFHYGPHRQFVTVEIIDEHTPPEAKAWGLLTAIAENEYEACFQDYVGV